jgi:hypothetical protein
MRGAAPRAREVTGVVVGAAGLAADDVGRWRDEICVRWDWVEDLNGRVGKS